MAGTELKQIVFDFDNDNRPMRESSFKGRLFEPQYEQALRQIDNYLYELGLEKTEQEERDRNIRKEGTEFISEDIDYNNNIFSFIGDRGTGKTSCMISVASILEEKEGIDKDNFPNIINTGFTTIDLIDPAYFDKSHNLLSLFLAKLYKCYDQLVTKDAKGDIARSNKQDFLQIYKDAHVQLHRLYNDKNKDSFSDEDLMEYVEDVSASVKLKRTIQDLVDAYLACLKRKDTILILRIDDVDMDIHHASEMIESVRKYFVQPNLLVFISCDIDQLVKIKRGDFYREFNDEKLKDWCHELADKYFAKVFPHSHRIQMPEPASYHGYKLRIKGNFETEAGLAVDSLDEEKKSIRDFVTVKQAVLELILKKTRYLFYNTNCYESYIVPRNLRELRLLMKLLVTMPDYKAGGRSHPHNKTLFKEYFYETWVRANLKSEDVRLVKKMMSVQDLSLFNKTLLSILSDRFVSEFNGGLLYEREKKPDTYLLPVTTADILAVVSEIEASLTQEDDRKLIFFIKSYYSILLYDSYCQIIEDLDENGNCKSSPKNKKTIGNIDAPIIRLDRLSEFYEYTKLVGGNFIHIGSYTNDAVLNASKFGTFINDCIELCKKKQLNKTDLSRLMLAEVLILSVYYSRKGSKNLTAVNIYEQMKEIPNDGNDNQLVVNVGAFLFNLTRYEESLKRYNSVFYEKLIKCNAYQCCKEKIMEAASLKNDYEWLHRISLRNFEVLQDIMIRKNVNGNNTYAPELFLEELKYLSDYQFPLYEHPKEGKDHYNISLTFLKPIVEGISKACSDKVFYKGLFIYSSDEMKDGQNETESDKRNVSQPATGKAVKGTGKKKH